MMRKIFFLISLIGAVQNSDKNLIRTAPNSDKKPQPKRETNWAFIIIVPVVAIIGCTAILLCCKGKHAPNSHLIAENQSGGLDNLDELEKFVKDMCFMHYTDEEWSKSSSKKELKQVTTWLREKGRQSDYTYLNLFPLICRQPSQYLQDPEGFRAQLNTKFNITDETMKKLFDDNDEFKNSNLGFKKALIIGFNRPKINSLSSVKR